MIRAFFDVILTQTFPFLAILSSSDQQLLSLNRNINERSCHFSVLLKVKNELRKSEVLSLVRLGLEIFIVDIVSVCKMFWIKHGNSPMYGVSFC